MSPCLKKGIGLGYVNTTNSKMDTTILIEIRDKKLEASVVKLPFVIT